MTRLLGSLFDKIGALFVPSGIVDSLDVRLPMAELLLDLHYGQEDVTSAEPQPKSETESLRLAA